MKASKRPQYSLLILILFCLLAVSCNFFSNKTGDRPAPPAIKPSPDRVDSLTFDSLYRSIQGNRIDKTVAYSLFKKLISGMESSWPQAEDSVSHEIIFPLKGYKSNSIGGKKTRGYIPNHYDFFDEHTQTGHPARDIFIYDKNQDCIDDLTRQPVSVLSMTDGIVLSTETNWNESSLLRGGNYILIYDPRLKSLFYYAHNKDVWVKAGDRVRSGDAIAIVGRTGLNANKKKSPTHLHVMQLKLDHEMYPRTIDCYPLLKASKLVD